MTRALKSTGETVKILKQHRNQSNNYKDSESRVYADLYRVKFNNGTLGVLCSTEIE
jgi:hypothetical protein|nr:MAG TPA: hypothetical protein [Caudoviricetes sp.]